MREAFILFIKPQGVYWRFQLTRLHVLRVFITTFEEFFSACQISKDHRQNQWRSTSVGVSQSHQGPVTSFPSQQNQCPSTSVGVPQIHQRPKTSYPPQQNHCLKYVFYQENVRSNIQQNITNGYTSSPKGKMSYIMRFVVRRMLRFRFYPKGKCYSASLGTF